MQVSFWLQYDPLGFEVGLAIRMRGCLRSRTMWDNQRIAFGDHIPRSDPDRSTARTVEIRRVSCHSTFSRASPVAGLSVLCRMPQREAAENVELPTAIHISLFEPTNEASQSNCRADMIALLAVGNLTRRPPNDRSIDRDGSVAAQ